MIPFLRTTRAPVLAGVALAALLPVTALMTGTEPPTKNPGVAFAVALAMWTGSRVVERGLGGLWQASAAGALVLTAAVLTGASLDAIAWIDAGRALPPRYATFFSFVFLFELGLGVVVGELLGFGGGLRRRRLPSALS